MKLSEIKKATIEYEDSNAQATQRVNTGPSYDRAANWIRDNMPESIVVLDYGAGRLHGSRILADNLKNRIVHSHEPYPREGVMPTHIDPPPGRSMYDVIVALNLLNVLKPEKRLQTVLHMKKLLRNKGAIIIGVRKWKGGVDGAKNRWDEDVLEPHSIFTKSEGRITYQKGYEGKELVDYLETVFGPGYEVKSSGKQYGDISAIVRKL